jgi:hypothetical protein
VPFHFGRTSGSSNSTIIEARRTCFLPRRISKFFSGLDNVWLESGLKIETHKKLWGCDLYSLPRELGIIRPMRGPFLAAQPPERLTARLRAWESLSQT